MTNLDRRMSRISLFNNTLGIIKEDGLKLTLYTEKLVLAMIHERYQGLNRVTVVVVIELTD